ncbi:hypothetical protein N7495_000943 [Penicillium taxi]|uniref:uncharacterized protein n=1 Tax=Penicillium taxi TaxID=168475 RepID=UPI002544F10C|nr:uncharacterized protein N7495_000943 [Penicillium taxi]KAJ5908261.1 hypothetical protein N7495_000943 [Penicillium taxi]
MELDSKPADDRTRRAASTISMDDLEAAQALEGLRSTQTIHTVPEHSPEPLLSLLTSSHPLLSSAINGSVSAYTTSKSYSARFKSSAEFIERNIGSPVANTVGTVGRRTGVESGLRWALQRREFSQESGQISKRRKVGDAAPPIDVEIADLSMTETPPPYEENTSPRYEERTEAATWQKRLVISTSGLGVAMSDESLRSLQYCLTWLRWANGRLGKSIVALQTALKEWENHKIGPGQPQSDLEKGGNYPGSASLLMQRIQAVKADVLSTLKQVVDIVSKYAGGALPENARHLVRRHLTSLPHRFQMASTSQPPPDSPAASSDAAVGAHRILVLANEGLDILSQVSCVVNDTLLSAEHWCERLGRKTDNKSALDVENPAELYSIDIKQPLVTGSTPLRDVEMTGQDA